MVKFSNSGTSSNMSLPKDYAVLNIEQMSAEEIIAHLQLGIHDMNEGRTRDASEAFEQFRKNIKHVNGMKE